MGFLEEKCTSCGAQLKVESSKDAAICQYCNTPFVVEKAINYYKNEISISNSKVTINNYGNNEVESKLQAADKLYKIGEVEEAEAVYRNLKGICPDDYRVWWGLFMSTHKFDNGYSNYKKAIALCDEPIRSELKKKYLELRKGTWDDCYEFDEECGISKSESLAKYFNSKLKEICEKEWKMALRHKYMYIVKSLFKKGTVEIESKNNKDYFYANDDNESVRFESFNIEKLARNTACIGCSDEWNEYHLIYLQLNTYVEKQEDIDVIVDKLRKYQVIYEDKPYDENEEKKFEQTADLVVGLLGAFLGW